MSSNFQFAFLGCQNNYLASVTDITASERPLGPSLTATYGLPDVFAADYKRYSNKKYFFNIRGHDFLSHVGQWHTLGSEGHVKACLNSHAEIEYLQELAIENNTKAKKRCVPNFNVTFGPRAGSFFADVCELKEYHWANLPRSLERKLQSLMSNTSFFRRNTYGKVHDIAINATEGWVLLRKQGDKYDWGGELPAELQDALQAGKERKAAISRIFLNHQHPTEYVLLLSDGTAHVSLHEGFKDQLKTLLELWAKNRGLKDRFRFYFRSTCSFPQPYQRTLNATYYNARGLFHLSHSNPLLALHYFNEAHEQARDNEEIHLNLGMALVAVRKQKRDGELEVYLAMQKEIRPNPIVLREGELGSFRMSYVGMEARGWDMEMLERRLGMFMLENKRGADEAWAYGMVGDAKEVLGEKGPVEMPGSPLNGRVYSHELNDENR